ncbi:D-2-hydroxyacid dehydrogenase [Pseudomonas putida]|uniref:D-2-hydroxyacid dehydrogenase n=1 Tax=Pseudomonas putida TaxID=303 RepID=UPI003F30A1C7
MKIVIGGADSLEQVPILAPVAARFELAFAPDDAALKDHLPDADVFVSWSFRDSGLQAHWGLAKRLRWVHWCGAGVKPVLFDELVRSEVVLTNARGIFDQAMAEYVLGMLLSYSLGLDDLRQQQNEQAWEYRQSRLLTGTQAVVFGVGGIGQRIGSLLKAAGVAVTGVGRTARKTSGVFGQILGREDRFDALAGADWVIAVMPETPDTDGYFSVQEFAAMRPSARFINIGRGNSVDEEALVAALRNGTIAGAALDVFQQEPLPASHPLWQLPGVTITPHVSGDYQGFEDDMCKQFIENLERFATGERLENVVDKAAGYVVAS